jgi:hypothetical protein
MDHHVHGIVMGTGKDQGVTTMWVYEPYELTCPVCNHLLVKDYKQICEVDSEDEFDPDEWDTSEYEFSEDGFDMTSDRSDCEHVVASLWLAVEDRADVSRNHYADIPFLYKRLCDEEFDTSTASSDAEIQVMANAVMNELAMTRGNKDNAFGDDEPFILESFFVPAGGGPTADSCQIYYYLINK